MTAPSTGLRGYAELRSSAAWYPLDRDVLSVTGRDAGPYLQGQCSQDVEALAPGRGAEALLLSPQGKVEVYLRVTASVDGGFVLDTDPGYGPAVAARLERFRLRTDVTVEPLDWRCIAVRGPDAASTVDGPPPVSASVEWPTVTGVDLLGPAPGRDEAARSWLADGVVECDAEAWEAVRIEAGIPVNGREIVEGTIAAEVGLVDRAVSFAKGCFTGQELVARLDARGSKVARSLCGVVLDTKDRGSVPSPETLVAATVRTPDEAFDVGHLSSVAWSPRLGTTVALATLHRRVVPTAPVVVDDGTSSLLAEARPLPLV